MPNADCLTLAERTPSGIVAGAMDLDTEYNNRARVPDWQSIIERWGRDAAAFRTGMGGELDLAYGEHALQSCDIFHTKDDAGGRILLFIHGGYWRSLDKSQFSHVARGLQLHGVTVAIANYRLCPEVALKDIVADVTTCAIWIRERTGRGIVAAGHSAGAHLAACLVATDWTAQGLPEDFITAGLGASGVYDLRPLLPTEVNGTLGLDEAGARAVSPVTWPVPEGRRFVTFVGAEESREFKRQSETLSAVWTGGGAPTSHAELAGVNHFTMVEQLTAPASAITTSLVELCRMP
jgi:arylformamidase